MELNVTTNGQERPDLNDQRKELPSELQGLFTRSKRSSLEEREHLQVYLRVRPFTLAEVTHGESQDCVVLEASDSVLLKPPGSAARLSVDQSVAQTGQRFHFSQVFGPETTQKDLFDGTVKDLVKDVLEGGNSLVFTYGVTNAGKTFTFLGPDADAGILPRALDLIFNSIEERVFTAASVKPQRCREFSRLSAEQQVEEASVKRNLLRQLKESNNLSFLNTSNRTFVEGSSTLGPPASSEDKVALEVEAHTKFSVWVSFCEIYNENIHDLLEALPGGTTRRTVLRLSQDIKGNAFVKDLRWVQVNSADEAFRLMKLGKKNQSFSSTRLNQLSSRSHSIFSVRILRIEDVGAARVHSVSELCLCDLAGSERCAKTQNSGERLKEAGNINTSLLILGKCINALRHNQQAKFLQHVPFRESKLTHYLQSFFCGRGRACMIVNVNQCASMYDETLNVLKFSAVAQKVVVLTSRILQVKAHRPVSEVSFEGNLPPPPPPPPTDRRSSLIGWDRSLEDVQEDVCAEGEDEVDEDLVMHESVEEEETEDGIPVSKLSQQKQVALLKQQLKRERAENLLIEARVREEISREFSELFSSMQSDFSDRLTREREILEERAERRLEIFKNLIDNMTGTSQDTLDGEALSALEKEKKARADLLAALEFQTVGKEEALASARELRREQQEALSTLEEERRVKEEALSALEEERRAKEEALSALEEERRAKEEALSALEEEVKEQTEERRRQVEELQQEVQDLSAKLELAQHPVKLEMDQAAQASAQRQFAQAQLDQQAHEIQEKNSQIHLLTLEAEGLKLELQKTRMDPEEELRTLELQTTQQIHQLRAKLQEEEEMRSRLEHQEKVDQLRAKLEEQMKTSEELKKKLVDQTKTLEELKQKLEDQMKTSEELEQKLKDHTKTSEELQENLVDHTKTSEELEQKLIEQTNISEELGQKLAEQTKTSEELKEKLVDQTKTSKELEQKLVDQTKTSEELEEKLVDQTKTSKELEQKLVDQTKTSEELKEKLVDQTKTSEDLEQKLVKQTKTSEELVEQTKSSQELKEKLLEQSKTSEKLDEQMTISKELEEKLVAQIKTSEELQKKLQDQQIASQKLLDELKEKLMQQQESSERVLEELRQKLGEQEAQLRCFSSSASAEEELKRLNCELQTEVESLRSKAVKASPNTTETEEKMVELQQRLVEKEVQTAELQKSLREALERKDEEDIQAVQEARRREVERRRELLAVAHEAIAQKDEELSKRAEEISRLKETSRQDSEKVTSLGVDLQRKDEETSDLREKLADYKKQIQQVQKEISSMREEEKVLRQKLSDADKSRKQLQSDVASRDRTIQQLKVDQSNSTGSDQNLQMYQKACKDLETKDQVMEDMRLALTEQEETQSQMEEVLEEKLMLIQDLTEEVEKFRAASSSSSSRTDAALRPADARSHDPTLAKQEAARAQQQLKLCEDKLQAERKRWLEEKLSLIGQAKEAEDKRNQEMRKFADDRERHARQQSRTEQELAEKEVTMQTWRAERDALVSALEVQIRKLLGSQSQKEQELQELRSRSDAQPPAERGRGADGGDGAADASALQVALREREEELAKLKEELKKIREGQEVLAQVSSSSAPPAAVTGKALSSSTRESVSSEASSGFPCVLDSSQISTENGRTSRFPRPELEISFSPLQPNRVNLRRHGDEDADAVTVKITRSTRKRKSAEMEKEEVEAENRRNTKTKLTPKKEEVWSSAALQGSSSSLRSRKEVTLQKIGDFLQSSPTLLGSKAKKMMSLVSGRVDAEASSSSSSLNLRAKKSKRKLYRPDISSPMEFSSLPIISPEAEERENDHQIIKRRLRSRVK